MSEQTVLVWSEELLTYHFGASHPMAPTRLGLTRELVRAFGLCEGVRVVDPPVATDAELELVHRPEYIAAVRAGAASARYGLGTADDPVFAGMHEAAARIAGGTLQAAREVWSGRARHAVNFAGGMHHAMPGRASGFCIYNDAAVAIRWLLDQGARRVAYVDIDAHHGDGVERAFWDDPRVLTISVHQSGMSLFPGTGFAQDCGGPHARGMAVNVALPPDTGDEPWLRAVEAVAAPLLAEFRPEVLVSQHGCDSHPRDPLTELRVSVDAQRIAAEQLGRWAADHADDRWVALGGGGYDIASTVPRVWANLVAIASGQPVDPERLLPARWRAHVHSLGAEVPQTMTDGRRPRLRPFDDGYDPADPVDQAILATRRVVFPEHGLGALL
ncbi:MULTISPECIES: acetoin utilization protein AcuC [unclassified Pseudactinotalea]|uniref:acetoin utilization protein AcuC n=1 Tax=unclassified Pseudactinotalea TaxID=2649176 RepID=UPI00128DC254|nr:MULTISPECIES: acetoin utilization protein AcuC [unclassified Pseudactinotalea]MPV50472.1 acetoin utilization protein AcuC [Pseudactinotalea sp. HY160]QGH70505.1 acetoin utilization protein AcuC [Pseudactinotalea sp. HY158]